MREEYNINGYCRLSTRPWSNKPTMRCLDGDCRTCLVPLIKTLNELSSNIVSLNNKNEELK